MLVALVCLWIGFALGFLCAAILHASGRSAREDRESLGAMRVARSPR